MTPDGRTVVAGLIGRPIEASLSPLLHTSWLTASGLNGAYLPFDLAGETEVATFVRGLRGGRSVRGLNVTAPYKAAALAAADRADLAAETAGAANLLLFEPDGTVTARNTDGIGLLHALRVQAGWRPQGRTVVLIGAGGAARGAAAALLAAGAAQLRVLNRTEARAQTLADALGQSTRAFSLARMAEAAAGADLLVNSAAGSGLELEAALEALAPGAAVMDMNYRPLRTPLLAEAARRGLAVVDGLEMLIGQAVPSFEAFFGRPPPAVHVRRLALDVLGETA